MRRLVVEGLGQPVARGREHAAAELEQTAPAEARVRLPAEPEAGRRPELRAEDAEGEIRIGHELVELPRPGVAELGGVRGAVRREEDARAVGKRRPRRELRVEVLDAEPVEIGLQLGVGGRARPERMPGGEDLVRETGLDQPVDGANRASEPLVPLQHADLPAGFREERRTSERVDPAADEDRIEARHSGRAYCLDMSLVL